MAIGVAQARRPASVVHLNVTDFAAAVATAKDGSLEDKAFVIVGASSGGATVQALSRRAREEGIVAGMGLERARRRASGLLVISRDIAAERALGSEMERIASRYSPDIENDGGGHVYLDLSGTERLFGPQVDCAIRMRREIMEATGVEPTVAVARNKLVAKVATRSIRPSGMASVRAGDEACFLAPQDAFLLPGVGPSIARLLSVTGLREIGELAALNDDAAIAIFGRQGISLRDAALGIDDTTVASGLLEERVIRRRLEFAEDMLEEPLMRAALVALVEDAGLELRKERLAAYRLGLDLLYADGVWTKADERSRSQLVLDRDLIAIADRTFSRAASRRVRLREIGLELSELKCLSRQFDLFEPEVERRAERLQAAVDASRQRFGPGLVTRASALIGRSGGERHAYV